MPFLASPHSWPASVVRSNQPFEPLKLTTRGTRRGFYGNPRLFCAPTRRDLANASQRLRVLSITDRPAPCSLLLIVLANAMQCKSRLDCYGAAVRRVTAHDDGRNDDDAASIRHDLA